MNADELRIIRQVARQHGMRHISALADVPRDVIAVSVLDSNRCSTFYVTEDVRTATSFARDVCRQGGCLSADIAVYNPTSLTWEMYDCLTPETVVSDDRLPRLGVKG